MISSSPIVAMLWENWRITRVEASQRLGVGLVLGAISILPDQGQTAFWILAMLHSMIWFSVAKLNGGRFADGYKPGFPLFLLFSRPVTTPVLVGVTIIYDALSCLVLYLVSAALLGSLFGKPLPLFSVALWIVACHFAYACVQWSTRSRVIQWVGSLVFFAPMFFLLKARFVSPLQVEFTLIDNLAMGLVCVVSFVLTVVGVSRQRRGDAVATVSPQKEWTGGFPDWLVTLFEFRCPTSSATRAQIWFELRTSGLPVLLIGLIVAVLIYLICALTPAFKFLQVAAIPIGFFAALVVLIGLGGNAFGIRRKQGRVYASAFELTQPYGTAQLAALKVLVRSACVLLALAAIGSSLWLSSSMVGDWSQALLANNQGALPLLQKIRQKFTVDFGSLPQYAFAGMAVVASIAVASVIAWQASREALRARNPVAVIVVQWLPTVWGLVSVILAVAHRAGALPVEAVRAYFSVSFMIAAAALVLATIYITWRGIAQGALTVRHGGIALAVAAVFGLAWRFGMPATDASTILWMTMPTLMVGVLAPWALSRVRHR
jgi:hypothetical protein